MSNTLHEFFWGYGVGAVVCHAAFLLHYLAKKIQGRR